MKIFTIVCLSVLVYNTAFTQIQNIDSTKSFFLQPVEIKAIRVGDKMPFTKTNINKQTIAAQNFGQDLPFLFNQTPSVVINADAGTGIGYTGIRIRGTDATRINVTLNGIPYNDAESQNVYFVDMPDVASSINSIQIQRGVGTSSNGAGAFGATINLSTNEFNDKPYAATYNTYGSFNTLKNTIKAGTGLINHQFILDMRLSTIKSNGFIDRASSNLQSLYISGVYINAHSSLRLNILSGKEKTYQAWNGIPEARLKGDIQGMQDFFKRNKQNGYDAADSMHLFNSANRTYNYFTYNNQTDNYQQNQYQLFFNHQWNSHTSFNVATFFTRGLGYYEEYKKAQAFSSYGLPNYIIRTDTIKTTNLIRQLWLDNYFYGNVFSLQYNKDEDMLTIGGGWSKYDGKHYGKIIWADINIPHDYTWYNYTAHKTDYNIYAKYQRAINQYWSLFGDVQYRNVQYTTNGFRKAPNKAINKSFNFFNPKLGIVYTNKDGLNAYASFSKASKEPNRDDFENNIIQEPKTEYLYDYELGVEKKFAQASVGATLYYMQYKNQLVLNGSVNDVGEYVRVNTPNSYRLGVELQGAVQFVDWITASANVTCSRNRIQNFTAFIEDYDAGTQKPMHLGQTDISFSPNVVGGLTLTATPIKHFNMDVVGKYVGRQFLDNTRNYAKSLKPYDVYDIRLGYTLSPRFCKAIQISAQINNIFNKKYESNGSTYSFISDKQTVIHNYYFPMAGTHCMLAVNVEW